MSVYLIAEIEVKNAEAYAEYTAQTPGLVALEKPLGALAVEIWILTHQDLRGNARVRALMDHLALAAVHDQALFSGQDDG